MKRQQVKKQVKAGKKKTAKPEKKNAESKKKKPTQKSLLRKKTGGKAKGKVAPQLTREATLAVQAHRMRETLREISNRFVTEVESDIIRAIEMMGEIADGARKKAELTKMSTALERLDIKPNKGRLGDLKRIRDLVRQINSRLEQML